MSDPVAHRIAEPPVGKGSYVSTDRIVEPCRIALEACPDGMSETLLMQLVAETPPTQKRLRRALRSIGAVEVAGHRWALAREEAA